MRRLRPSLLCFAIACFVHFSLQAADQRSEVLTLSTSLERALQNNPQLLSAQKEISIAKTQVRQAKSLFYPRVNFNVNYVRYRNETLGMTSPDLGNIVLEAPLPDSSPGHTKPFADNLYLGRFDFKQTLFAGGRLNYTYKLSMANLKTAEREYESLKRDIEFKTRQSFSTLLAIKIKKQRLTDGSRLLETLLSKSSDQSIRLSLIERKANLREQSAALFSQEQKARIDYQTCLGMELFSEVDVSGELDERAPQIDLQTALAWAKQSRAELRQTELQAEVDQLSVDLSMAERYPVFLLGGSYEMRNTEFPLNNVNWNTVLSMNIPIFDGFSSLARIKESRYRADKGRLGRIQLEDAIDREVRSTFEDVLFWQQEMAARKDDLKTLEKEKAKTVADMAHFVEWHTALQLKLTDAQLQYVLAKASLEKAIGRMVS